MRHRRLVLGITGILGLLGLLLVATGSEPESTVRTLDGSADAAVPGIDHSAPVREMSTDLSQNPAAPLAEVSNRAAVRRSTVARAARRRPLTVCCCPTAFAGFVSRLERVFERETSNVDLVLRVLGDRDCVDHLLLHNANIAIISTDLSVTERRRGLVDRTLCHRIIVPVVHRTNRLASVTREDIQRVLRGKESSWEHLGGPPLEIQPVCAYPPRLVDAANRQSRVHDDAAAHAVFLDTPRQIIAYVSNHPRALGLVDFVHARRDRDVRMLQISNSSPSREAFTRRAWPLGATIRAVTSGTGEPSEDVVRFLDFLASEAARKVIRLGFTLPNRKK